MINSAIQSVLQQAVKQLSLSDTAHLDAQLLLCQTLNTSRAALLAWPERQLNYEQLTEFESLLRRRTQGEPLAYILGYKDFWNLTLQVSSAVLIPRPETETLIEWVLEQFTQQSSLKVADLGTGSGAIALTLAKERPLWQVYATEKTADPLEVAITNAETYQLKNVTFLIGDWCQALPEQPFDLLISNPPYIAPGDHHLTAHSLQHEPDDALIAADQGFAALFTIAKEALSYLKPRAPLLLEHGFEQGERLRLELQRLGYRNVQTLQDLAGLERITIGYAP